MVNQMKLTDLLDKCRRSQGEYRLPEHGSGSWATTYSNEFIRAAAEIASLLLKEKSLDDSLKDMTRYFKRSGIQSCRGAEMNIKQVRYLYDTHLKKEIEERFS